MFEDVRHGIERRRMFAQRLAGVEREQRGGSTTAFEENAADCRAFLMAHELSCGRSSACAGTILRL